MGVSLEMYSASHMQSMGHVRANNVGFMVISLGFVCFFTFYLLERSLLRASRKGAMKIKLAVNNLGYKKRKMLYCNKP